MAAALAMLRLREKSSAAESIGGWRHIRRKNQTRNAGGGS